MSDCLTCLHLDIISKQEKTVLSSTDFSGSMEDCKFDIFSRALKQAKENHQQGVRLRQTERADVKIGGF